MVEINDHSIDYTIPKYRGIGIEITDSDKNQFITVYEGGFPREAVLDISSWQGISAGAVHYYAVIHVQGLYQKLLKKGSKETRYKEGTRIMTFGGKDTPEEIQGFDIQINRLVTQEDLDLNGGRTFETYDLGDYTHRFNTKKELIAAAKKSFKRIFEPGWKLVLKVPVKKKDETGDYWEDTDKILAKT